MYIPGHLSVGYLLVSAHSRARGTPPRPILEVAPALLGTLTPDIIDKSLYFLDITGHGRTLGHSFLTLGGLILGWWVMRRLGRESWEAPLRAMGFWLLGIASHLGIDFLDDALRGFLHGRQVITTWFLWPVLEAGDWRWESAVALVSASRTWLYFEAFVVAMAVVAATLDWKWGRKDTTFRA